MTREQAKAAPTSGVRELVVVDAAWPWIVDAVYDRGLMLFQIPLDQAVDGEQQNPAYAIAPRSLT